MMKTYKSEAAAAIHEMISDLHEVGLVDKKTMRHFDESCLTPVKKLSPAEIKAIREEANASQTVFARYLNVSPLMGEQMGARREIAQRFHAQTVGVGEEKWTAKHRMTAQIFAVYSTIKRTASTCSALYHNNWEKMKWRGKNRDDKATPL